MGLIVLDAGVLIGFLDANDPHHESAHQALTTALGRSDQLVIPASALAEVLVGPARQGDDAVAVVLELMARLPIDVAPLDTAVAVEAAQLRAQHRSLRLPDALIIATAKAIDANELVTTDRQWPSRRVMNVDATITTL